MADPDDARTLWDAAMALNRAAGAVSVRTLRRSDQTRGKPMLWPLPPLLFFTDPLRTPEPWRTAAALPTGAAVIYRHFGALEAEVAARRLREVTAARGVRLLIGLDIDLAEEVGADGVHLPERALAQAPIIRTTHPAWLITGAIHAPGSTLAVTGLDAFVLSPIFQAGGGSAPKPALGVNALTDAASNGQAVYGLGGITAHNVGKLTGSGACGIAGVDSIATAFGTPAE